MKKYLPKIDRIAAWVLMVVTILYAITGFGMTKGIIDYQLAQSFHLYSLGLIGLIAFLIHTSYAVSMALRRWRIWNIYSKIILGLIYIVMTVSFLYLGIFYNSNVVVQKQNNQQTSNSTSIPITSVVSDTLKTFSLQELASYNGISGKPAYVAVDGLVYDLSSIFMGGQHRGYSAGQDLSVAFHGQHPESFLSKYKVVGQLVK